VQDQSCLITINAKGIILSVNGKAAQLFGYKKVPRRARGRVLDRRLWTGVA
jgi:PAS domain-containing protein